MIEVNFQSPLHQVNLFTITAIIVKITLIISFIKDWQNLYLFKEQLNQLYLDYRKAMILKELQDWLLLRQHLHPTNFTITVSCNSNLIINLANYSMQIKMIKIIVIKNLYQSHYLCYVMIQHQCCFVVMIIIESFLKFGLIMINF